MGLPPSYVAVYGPPPLTLLALGGPLGAVGGTLFLAGGAASADTATAPRAE